MFKSLWIPILAITLFLGASQMVHAKKGDVISIDGVRYSRTVFPGLFYRSGGPGGTTSMKDSSVEALCEKGYSAVLYAYPEESFRNKGSHKCDAGSIDYIGTGFRKGGEQITLQRVYQAANNGEGPVLVHCWNGFHASGEVAAYALIQFCGWSHSAAADYWGKMMPASERKRVKTKYRKIVERVMNYEKVDGMDFTDAQREKYCHPDTKWGDEE